MFAALGRFTFRVLVEGEVNVGTSIRCFEIGKIGVYIRDSRSGRVINRYKVDMVQLAENPEWTPKNVKVKLLIEWRLPEG